MGIVCYNIHNHDYIFHSYLLFLFWFSFFGTKEERLIHTVLRERGRFILSRLWKWLSGNKAAPRSSYSHCTGPCSLSQTFLDCLCADTCSSLFAESSCPFILLFCIWNLMRATCLPHHDRLDSGKKKKRFCFEVHGKWS